MTDEEVIDPKAFVMAQRVKWIIVWKRTGRNKKPRPDMYLAYTGSWTRDKNCAKSFKTKALALHYIRLNPGAGGIVESIFV